jgi:hypothetical protein
MISDIRFDEAGPCRSLTRWNCLWCRSSLSSSRPLKEYSQSLPLRPSLLNLVKTWLLGETEQSGARFRLRRPIARGTTTHGDWSARPCDTRHHSSTSRHPTRATATKRFKIFSRQHAIARFRPTYYMQLSLSTNEQQGSSLFRSKYTRQKLKRLDDNDNTTWGSIILGVQRSKIESRTSQ